VWMLIGSVLMVSVVTLVILFAGAYAYGMAHLHEIKENWVKYRCNPVYMPLAGMVGSDISTNFMNCTLQSVNTYTGFVMDPIYQNFSMLTDIIQTILGSMNDMRGAVSGASSGFLGIIAGTFGKLQNTFQEVALLFGRVRSIMNRMMTSFAILMNIVTTGLQTGQSVANGPIGAAAEFFCFQGDTLVDMLGDAKSRICDIQPGHYLRSGAMVKSVLVFDGTRTEMKRLGKVYVSGNHKVLHGGKWIRVEDHPDAAASPSFKRIYCLNVEDHVIQSEGYTFKDYEETDNPEILAEFFRRVEEHYGVLRSPQKTNNPLEYRYSGVRPSTFIVMDDDVVKAATEVRIGDVLGNGKRVQAVIRHHKVRMSSYEQGSFAMGTWMEHPHCGVTPVLEDDEYRDYADAIQFIVEGSKYEVLTRCGGRFTILDDHEVSDDDDAIHDWRDEQIQKEKEHDV
jgi:hypothetical protein